MKRRMRHGGLRFESGTVRPFPTKIYIRRRRRRSVGVLFMREKEKREGKGEEGVMGHKNWKKDSAAAASV